MIYGNSNINHGCPHHTNGEPFGERDTVGEFPKQRTYAFHSTEYKELCHTSLLQADFLGGGAAVMSPCYLTTYRDRKSTRLNSSH